jgi:uncharacterized protein YgfB (UPF0149 family)
MSKLPLHQTVELQLLEAECDHSASEVHGILLGLIAATGHPGFMQWLNEFMPAFQHPDRAHPEALKALAMLHVATAKSVADEGFDVPLLLPDDEIVIDVRTAALADLSRGLLLGIAAGGVDSQTDLSEDSGEIISDLTELCHIVSGDDGDEDAYTELSDYLAVSVRLLHVELKSKHRSAETQH